MVRNSIRDVRLNRLFETVEVLAEKIEYDGFYPDCIVYLETGARLIASEFHQMTGAGVVPLRIQRKGGRLKAAVAKTLKCLPTPIKDGLRILEARLLWKRLEAHRKIENLPDCDLSASSVLIVDDAADTGSTLRIAKDWVLSMGARPQSIRTAVITVTTPDARPLVDYSLYEEMCRFPWSSDSSERLQYQEVYEKTRPPKYQDSAV